MKLGMTGTRNGMSDNQKLSLNMFLEENNFEEVHHGDCIGSDADFHEVSLTKKLKIVIHPPINSSQRAYCKGENVKILPKKEYLSRNKDIVNDTDVLISFVESPEEILRSGTWSTIRYARRINKKVIIVLPNGKFM